MAKTSTKIVLPTTISVCHYLDFEFIEDIFKQIGLKIKVKEVGCYDCRYIGVIYQKKDAAYKILLKQVKAYTVADR